MSVRVLLADDQELVRTGLRMILDAQPGIDVVGEAADGREAVALARELRPDVCLFDVRMPELDGLEATRLLVRDDGEGGASDGNGGRPGYGLIGMAERAALLGGTIEAGPGPTRGWTVCAVLPRVGTGS